MKGTLRNTPRNFEYPTDLGFIVGVMLGSSYEAKCWIRDFTPFNEKFSPDWEDECELRKQLLESGRDVWVVFSDEGKSYHEKVVSPSGIRFTKELTEVSV